jgi:hypothetical protein
MTSRPLDPYISLGGVFHDPGTPSDNGYHQPGEMRSFATAVRTEGDGSYSVVGHNHDTTYEQLARKAQANGYAPLDANSLVPTIHIPPLAVTDTFVAANQAEMLALTAQRGDLCIRTDTGRTYVLAAEPASTLANWKEVLAAGQVTSVNGQTGVVNLTATNVGAATPADVTSAISNHEAASNPHPIYLTQAEGDSFYALIGHNHTGVYATPGDVTTAITNHENAANPHPIYLTQAEADLLYAVIGHNHDGTYLTQAQADLRYALIGHNHDGTYATPAQVTSAISTHEAAANPHPVYLTQAEADLLYAVIGHNHDSIYSPLSHNHDAAYVNVTGDTITGPLTVNGVPTFQSRIEANAGIIAAGDAEFYGDLYARTTLSVTTSLSVAGKAVTVSPDAGNSLVWNANGFFVAAGSIPISPDAGNILEMRANGLYVSQGLLFNKRTS